MKKFLILSALVGTAGLGVGFAYHPGASSPEVVALEAPAAAPVESTTTTGPPATATTVKPASKVAAKSTPTTARQVTTTTTAARVAAPTTAPTTATTVTTMAKPAGAVRKCSITVAKPSVMYGEQQTVTITSSLPNTHLKLKVTWNNPGKSQTTDATTDAAGGFTKTFESISGGTAVVWARIDTPDDDGYCGQVTFESKYPTS